MLNFVKQNSLIEFNILSVSLPRVIIALIVAIIIIWICIRIASQVFDALKNKTFELSKDWEIHFSSKPLRFCLLVLCYSAFFIIFLYAGCCAVYGLFTR